MPLNTDKSTSVTDALNTRITCRDFLDTPVPEDVLMRVLNMAMRSPSGGNLQPWKSSKSQPMLPIRRRSGSLTALGAISSAKICTARLAYRARIKWAVLSGWRKTPSSLTRRSALLLRVISVWICPSTWILAYYYGIWQPRRACK